MAKVGQIVIPTLRDLFIERIEDMILTGKLQVGERLPTERELEEQTNISKTVIHEGLVELESKGFVKIVPRKGTFVVNYTETGTLETLNAQIRHNGGMLTRRQLDSLIEARVAVEGAALKKLAEHHSQEDIAALEGIVAAAEDFAAGLSGSDYTELAEYMFRFNRGLCSLCGNLMFPLILNDFKPVFLVFWELSLRRFGVGKNIRLLRKFIGDIKNGDAGGAQCRLKRSAEEFAGHYDEYIKDEKHNAFT